MSWIQNKLNRYFTNMHQRSRQVLLNVISAFVIKGLALVLSLFTMPAYLRFFHDDMALGLWFTVLSVLSWILNFDLGIGNGLRNHLARELACGNREKARRYISSGYIAIGILCAAAVGIFCCICGRINWNGVFGIEAACVSGQALQRTVKIVFLGIILQMFLKIISSVFYAMQRSSVNNFLSLCTSVLTLVLVSVIPSGDNDRNVIAMAWIHAAAVAAPLLAATLAAFLSPKLRGLAPKAACFDLGCAREVMSLGGAFFFVQIAYMVIMSTNEYCISLFAGANHVVDYQIYYKVFSLGSTVFTLALTPVWSAVTNAAAQNNISWIRSLYKKMLLIAAAGSACEFLAIPVMQLFIDLWLGTEAIAVNPAYGAVFASLGSAMLFNSVFSSIANGLGKLRVQALFFGVGALVKLPLAMGLTAALDSWIGVVVANVLCMGMYCFAQPYVIGKLFKRMEQPSGHLTRTGVQNTAECGGNYEHTNK